MVVRYADDLVALCVSREQAEQVKARLAAWLAPRGLAFNEDKTTIVHLDDGFDFLGFNVRRYRGKLLIKPSKAALRRHRERLAAEMKALRGANASAVLQTTEPDHSGMVGLLPDGGVQRGVRQAGHARVEAHLQVGHATATRTNRSAGSSTGTSASSTSPGVTGGSSVTVTAAPTCSSTPGPRSSATRWSQARRHPTTRPWPTTGPGGDNAAPPPLDGVSLRLLQGAARTLPGLRWTAAARRPRAPNPPRVGAVAHGDPQSGPQTSGHRRAGPWHGRTTPSRPSHTRPVPATANRRGCTKPSNLLHARDSLGPA